MGKTDRPAKPKLRDLDDLLGLNSSVPLSIVSAQEPLPDTQLTTLPLSELQDYPGHPFHLYSGERRQDMIDSIREKGIMQPLIVWETAAGEYQILSGITASIVPWRLGWTLPLLSSSGTCQMKMPGPM